MPKIEFQVHYCCFPSRKFFAHWQFENHVGVKRRPHRMFGYGDLIIWMILFVLSVVDWVVKWTIDELKSKRDWWCPPKGKDILKQVFTFWLYIKWNKKVQAGYRKFSIQQICFETLMKVFCCACSSEKVCLSGKYRSINLSGGKKYLSFYPFVWKKVLVCVLVWKSICLLSYHMSVQLKKVSEKIC